jgi:hypothetical protein
MRRPPLVPYFAAAAVLGAASWALVRKPEPPAEPMAAAPAEPPRSEPANESFLPPDHPPIPAGMQGAAAPGGPTTAGDGAPAIVWKVPQGWQTAMNPSPMRIATYRPTAAVDVSVSRAGGATDANIDRWVHQFEGASPPKRTDTTVAGLAVHVVEVSGTYAAGGMMMGSAPEPHPGYSLVGAIVETDGPHYFFKMVGPSADVASARPGFDALIHSIARR